MRGLNMAEFNGIDIVDTVYEGINTHVFRGIMRDENQPVILKTTSSTHPSPMKWHVTGMNTIS